MKLEQSNQRKLTVCATPAGFCLPWLMTAAKIRDWPASANEERGYNKSPCKS